MKPLPRSDAADRPEASCLPNLDIDGLEDVLAEMIAETQPNVKPEVMRVVVAIAAGALRNSENQERLVKLFGSDAPSGEDLRVFAAEMALLIDGDPDPQLQAKCVDFAVGLGLGGGKSQTVIAQEHGVGKATISARCRRIIKFLGRKPARGMKPESAVDSYSKRQLGKRARPPREPWKFVGFLSRCIRHA